MNSKTQTRQIYWHQHLTAWRSSGLTQAAYCREHHLKPSTFSNWLSRDKAQHTPVTLIPIQLKPQDTQATASLHHPNGWTVQFPHPIAPSWLAAVLRELA